MTVKLCAWATMCATTTAQCTLGTVQDGEREKINNRFQFQFCVSQRNDQTIAQLDGITLGKTYIK